MLTNNYNKICIVSVQLKIDCRCRIEMIPTIYLIPNEL